MKKQILVLLISYLIHSATLADCYLTTEIKETSNSEVLKQVALIELSTYFEPISEPPLTGLKESDCRYHLSVKDLDDRTMVFLKTPDSSSYGDSKMKGMDGFKHALFALILRSKPDKKQQLCERHSQLLSQECSEKEKSAPKKSVAIQTAPKNDLVWQKKTTYGLNWGRAINYCEELEESGKSDWRLPTREDFLTLTPKDRYILQFESDYYWSSTQSFQYRDYAWGYNTLTSDLFDDGWIKNQYYVKCVRGGDASTYTPPKIVFKSQQEIQAREKEEGIKEKEDENIDHSVGWRFEVGPTYLSGFGSLLAVYIDNMEETGGSVEDPSITPISTTGSIHQQYESGFRYGAEIGPIAYIVISGETDEADFIMIPVNFYAGYRMQSDLFFRGGLSFLNASGEFVSREIPGLMAAVGMEFRNRKKIGMAAELGYDSASVEIDSYDCSDNPTADSLSDCDKSTKQITPIGFKASFKVIF